MEKSINGPERCAATTVGAETSPLERARQIMAGMVRSEKGLDCSF